MRGLSRKSGAGDQPRESAQIAAITQTTNSAIITAKVSITKNVSIKKCMGDHLTTPALEPPINPARRPCNTGRPHRDTHRIADTAEHFPPTASRNTCRTDPSDQHPAGTVGTAAGPNRLVDARAKYASAAATATAVRALERPAESAESPVRYGSHWRIHRPT